MSRDGNMSELARKTGLTREGLYKGLSGEGNPSFSTVTKVAAALGLRLSFKPAQVRSAKSKSASAAKPRRPDTVKAGNRLPKPKRQKTVAKKAAAKRRKFA